MMKSIVIFFLTYFGFIPLCISQEISTAESINIPTNKKSHWIEVSFDKIPSNRVQYQQTGMIIDVDKSASPLIYPFSKAAKVKQLKIKAQITGQLNLPKDKKQGTKGFDDFILRIGLVKAGKKTLSLWEKIISPKWITVLFKLAPDGVGIEKIEFLNIPNSLQLTGTKRIHPISRLIQETFLAPANSDGQIEVNYTYPEPINTLALWLSIDGDDTHSKYQVHISEIVLNLSSSSNTQ